MTEPAYQPGRGGGRVAAVLLAVVFLAVIGATAGYLAGHQVRKQRAADARAAEQGGGEPTGQPEQPSEAGSPSTHGSSTWLPGKHCPKASEDTAKTQLIQVFYLKTNRSQVWICRDADNGLFYQGLQGGGDTFTDQNSILVPDVQDTGNGTYVAVNHANNGTWKYLVSKQMLVIQKSGGDTSTEPAVSSGSG